MVFEKVKEILIDLFKVPENIITLDTRLDEELNADSLDKVEIVTQLEDSFNIIIDYDDALKVKTVKDIVMSIEKLI